MAEIQKLITDISIDLYGETKRYLVQAKQGDNKTRFVRITLLNNGKEFEIPEGAAVLANITKPDGKKSINYATILDDGKVLMALTKQSLAVAGTAIAEVEIMQPETAQTLTSASFTVEIEPNERGEDTAESSDEMGALEDELAKALAIELQVSTAEAARVAAETSRAQAEEARTQNETARKNAETTRGQEEQKRATAEQQRATAETSRVQAETSRATAEKARSDAESDRKTAETFRVQAEQQREAMKDTMTAATTAANTAAANAQGLTEEVQQGVNAALGSLSTTGLTFYQDATDGGLNVLVSEV